ncbi:MAG: hypothetical protein KBC78_01050 [Candidatus Pacebacteria bacterium]|nr:hypothetical protein [Candidatus Paceibacterota bacterium]
MRIKKIYIYTGLTCLILGFSLFVAGCNIKSKELKTILASSAVSMELSTAHEIKQIIQDKEVSLGKPIYAEVRIQYEPIGQHTKEDVFREIVAILEKDQWQRSEMGIDDRYYVATLNKDSFPLLTEVFNNKENTFVSLHIINRSH